MDSYGSRCAEKPHQSNCLVGRGKINVFVRMKWVLSEILTSRVQRESSIDRLRSIASSFMAAFARRRPGGRKKEGSTVPTPYREQSFRAADGQRLPFTPTYMSHQQTQKPDKSSQFNPQWTHILCWLFRLFIANFHMTFATVSVGYRVQSGHSEVFHDTSLPEPAYSTCRPLLQDHHSRTAGVMIYDKRYLFGLWERAQDRVPTKHSRGRPTKRATTPLDPINLKRPTISSSKWLFLEHT